MEKNAITKPMKGTQAITVKGLYKLRSAIKADMDAFTSIGIIDGMTEWHGYDVTCQYNMLNDLDHVYLTAENETVKEAMEDYKTAKYTIERFYGTDDDILVTMTAIIGYENYNKVVKELTVDSIDYVGCKVLLVD